MNARVSTVAQPAAGLKVAAIPIRFLALAVVSIPLAAGCGGAEESGPVSVVIDSDQIARHSPEDDLWDVADMLEKDGVIWVLAPAEPFIRGLRSGGEEIAFGSQGDGPGELRSPRALLAPEGSDRVAVWDAAARLYRVFSVEGELISESAAASLGNVRGDIDAVTFGDPLRVASMADGGSLRAEYSGQVNFGGALWTGTLVRESETGAPRPVVDFQDLRGAAQVDPEAMSFLGPVPLWDACPEGGLAVLDPVSRHLHFVEADWASRDSLFVPWDAVPLTRTDRMSYLAGTMAAETQGQEIEEAQMEAMLSQAEEATRGQFAESAPLAVDLRCAGGQAWLQVYDGGSNPLGYGRRWRVIGLPGAGVSPRSVEVTLPSGFQVFRVSGTRLLGVVTDDLGRQRVASIPLPASLRSQ